MSRRNATLAVFPVAFAFLLALCATASAVPVVDGHFALASPTGTNNKLVAGPDGNIWVTVRGEVPGEEKDVARVTPAGAVTEFDLKGISGVENIAVGPEGKLWVTAVNTIASFSPSDPTKTSEAFANNEIGGNNPIVAGPDGQLWIASEEKVIHLKPSEPGSEKENEYPVAGLSPRDIDVTGSQLVIADAGKPRIVTMTTAGVEKEYPIGYVKGAIAEGASQGVAGSPSGLIGFSQPGAAPEQIGLLMPPNPAQSFSRDGDPFGVALGSDGAFWIALSGSTPTNVGVERLTATGEATYLGGLPDGFTPRQIAAGPNNTIWVTIEHAETAEYEIVRISGLEPPVEAISHPTSPPQTTIAKGPKKTVKAKGKFAKVSFRFSASSAGATFECALSRARKGKKPAKSKFRACKSPKTYKLRPAKYTFSVRAVSAGVTDPTPATSSFRVIHHR